MNQFDEAAATYDEVAESDLGRALRARVHDRLRPLICSGDVVLDVGAGTGIDAAMYAGWGASVTALEPSIAMARIARGRAADRVEVAVESLESWAGADDAFDVVVSNFGALNCVPDLQPAIDRLVGACRPGGHIVLVVMGRCAPWEVAGGIRHRDGDRIRRRTRGHAGEVSYWSPRAVSRAMGERAQLVVVESLGWALPTFAQRQVVDGRPRTLRALAWLDRAMARPLGRIGVGDHWIGRWTRR